MCLAAFKATSSVTPNCPTRAMWRSRNEMRLVWKYTASCTTARISRRACRHNDRYCRMYSSYGFLSSLAVKSLCPYTKTVSAGFSRGLPPKTYLFVLETKRMGMGVGTREQSILLLLRCAVLQERAAAAAAAAVLPPPPYIDDLSPDWTGGPLLPLPKALGHST
ncbi:hypothetical protein LY76DRAFT_399274 [Colletotrichum caudatum]|nr:hypothetical protein LY76DRAFT_399274 [Colletotrichum caudatum]